ncbi:TPA: hypothetical protein G9F27_003372 [Salmonella enterica]|uniref:Uncharacterized protein n=1 Tax=Salmonella enterica TaxID=28901 RepID=A0A743PGK5_SALER|nr:hypothetical protein [Salmonella enterica]
MSFNEYEAFAVTVGEVLQELTVEAIAKRNESVGSDRENFDAGYLSAFHRIITLIQQQADLFDIPLEKICMDTIKESDLI